MSEWTVTDEAVKAMQELADRINHVMQEIEFECQQLATMFEDNKNGLGYHSNEISKLIINLSELEKNAQLTGKKLVNKLIKSAAVRKAHITKSYSSAKNTEKESCSGIANNGKTEKNDVENNKLSAKKYAEYVLHELESFEKTLELTDGTPGVLQLGGYHGEVKKDASKVAEKFESHHIPSQGALADNADNLPTIAISKEDHKLTDSYAGKQRKRYSSIFPDLEPGEAYKAGVIQMIKEGRFVEIVRDEIYNLIDQFGHKYDGGIKQYLEALRQYIEKHGVPKAKGEK